MTHIYVNAAMKPIILLIKLTSCTFGGLSTMQGLLGKFDSPNTLRKHYSSFYGIVYSFTDLSARVEHWELKSGFCAI